MQVGFGICQCNKVTKVEDICNGDCQKTLVRKTFSDNNRIILTDPVTNTKVETDLTDTLG